MSLQPTVSGDNILFPQQSHDGLLVRSNKSQDSKRELKPGSDANNSSKSINTDGNDSSKSINTDGNNSSKSINNDGNNNNNELFQTVESVFVEDTEGNGELHVPGVEVYGADNDGGGNGSDAAPIDREEEIRVQLEKLAPFPSKDETKILFPPIIIEQDFSKKYYYNAIRSYLPSISNSTVNSVNNNTLSSSNTNNLTSSSSSTRRSSPLKRHHTSLATPDTRAASSLSSLPDVRSSPNRYKLYNDFKEATNKQAAMRTAEEVEALFNGLKKLKSLEALNNDHKIKELCRVLKFEKFPANHTVYKQGEVGDAFYIIYKGSVRVQVREESTPVSASTSKSFILLNSLRNNTNLTSNNNTTTHILGNNTSNSAARIATNGDQFVTILQKGDRFGLLLSHFEDVVIRTYTVVTVTNTTLIRIEKDDYIRLLKFSIKKECEENLEFLKCFGVFHSVSPSSLSRLAEHVIPYPFKQNDIIIQSGGEVDGIYFICSGRCKVTKSTTYTHKGKTKHASVVVVEAGQGELVGELEVFRKNPQRQVQVVATENMKTLFAPLYELDKRITLAMLEMMKAFVDERYPSDTKLWDIFLQRKKEKKWIAYKEKLTNDIVGEHQSIKKLSKLYQK